MAELIDISQIKDLGTICKDCHCMTKNDISQIHGPFKWHSKHCIAKKINIDSKNGFKPEDFHADIKNRNLRHQNLISVFMASYDKLAVYVLQEYADTTLEKVLHPPTVTGGLIPFPMQKNLEWSLQCARGLQYLHDSCFTFNLRPLRSKRVLFLTSTQTLKLGTDVPSCEATTCHSKYDIAWSSPESVANCVEDAKKSDVWSLGVVFYEIFVRKHPYAEKSTEDDLKDAIMQQKCRLELRTKNSRNFESLLSWCCAYPPSERPDLLQIIKDLERPGWYIMTSKEKINLY